MNMENSSGQIKIESLSYGGNGVGRDGGKVVFVPLTAPGDIVAYRTIEEKKGYIKAELSRLIEPSAKRREPPCPVSGECGGCSWQYLPYQEQLSAKREIFKETMWRLGTVEKDRILEIIAAPSEWHYRNRAQFKASFANGRLRIGFYRRKSRAIVEMNSCAIMSPLINETLSLFKKRLLEAPFRERVSRIDISVDDADEGAVAVIHLDSSLKKNDVIFARKNFSTQDKLRGLFFRSGKTSALEEVFSCDNGLLTYSVPAKGKEIDLKFSPGGFTQVNYLQNRRLVELVVDIAGKGRAEKVLDLFCGIGNFSLPLAAISKKVTAVESNKASICDAIRNAKEQGRKNCNFIAGRAENYISENYDLAVVDPPREGAASVIKKLVRQKVPRVIYVSCNPATLARDLRLMTRGGYKILSSRPVDLFPQTYHIESVTEIALQPT